VLNFFSTRTLKEVLTEGLVSYLFFNKRIKSILYQPHFRYSQVMFIWLPLISLFLAISANKILSQEQLPALPHIIVILADDMGYGDVSSYNPRPLGNISTPNIDRMARNGMMFMDAHASSSVCTPSRYSLLTGHYNWRTWLKSGVLKGFSPPLIQPNRSTLASILKSSGYRTACVGKWWVL
jgi:arylsulfatase A